MGRLTIAARFSDLEVVCFKIAKTKEFTEIQNVLFLLDENKFKEFLSEKDYYNKDRFTVDYATHTEYDSKKAFFAPFDYGIVFIDFFNKKVFSYNNYSAFLETPIYGILHNIAPLMKDEEFLNNKDKFYNYTFNEKKDYEIIKNYNLFDDFCLYLPFFFNIHKTLLNDGKIVIKDYFKNEKKTIYKDVDTMSFFNQFKKDYFINYESGMGGLDFMSLACQPEEWEFIQNVADKKPMEELYNTLRKDIEFTCEEQECWQQYFKED